MSVSAHRARLIPGDGEGHQAAKDRHRAPDKFAFWHCQAQIGQAVQQGVQRDLALQPGEGRSQAVVCTVAKGQMALRATLKVELLRLSEVLGVAVR